MLRKKRIIQLNSYVKIETAPNNPAGGAAW